MTIQDLSKNNLMIGGFIETSGFEASSTIKQIIPDSSESDEPNHW